MESMTSGTLAGTGTYRCTACAYELALARQDELPPCPSCGGGAWERAPLATETALLATAAAAERPAWLDEVREGLDEPGQYLAYELRGRQVVVRLEREWTRIGRSLGADVRFEDPTVSRRHALVARQPDGLRVLDDRSLNGIQVNGERVEWHTLRDGDEIAVGRHRLFFLDLAVVPVAAAATDEPGEAVAPA